MRKFLIACATIVMILSGQSLASKVKSESNLETNEESLGYNRWGCNHRIHNHRFCKHNHHHRCCHW